MTPPSEALVVDFAPHAVRYAGSFEDRWFVSLVQLVDEREAGATTAAEILQYVYADKSGADRGVVHHDVRFGNETDDVVAELAATLGGEPIAFAQTSTREDALEIRAGKKTRWVSFVPGGLDAIVRWMNVQLSEAGARRRIYSLATESDWSCYIVCAPDAVEAMKRRGLRGLEVP